MTLTHINTHAHRHTRSHPHTLKIMINVRRFSAVLGTYERWPVVIPCISIPCYIRVGLSRGSDRRSRRYFWSWRIRSYWRCYASASSSFRVQALVQTCEQNNQEFLCVVLIIKHTERNSCNCDMRKWFWDIIHSRVDPWLASSDLHISRFYYNSPCNSPMRTKGS